MFVTVVGRMAGVDTSLYSGNGGYSDVTAGSWYAPYVVWASENKVAQGYGGGKFGPNDAVTREQMAAMLLRWACLLYTSNREFGILFFHRVCGLGVYGCFYENRTEVSLSEDRRTGNQEGSGRASLGV